MGRGNPLGDPAASEREAEQLRAANDLGRCCTIVEWRVCWHSQQVVWSAQPKIGKGFPCWTCRARSSGASRPVVHLEHLSLSLARPNRHWLVGFLVPTMGMIEEFMTMNVRSLAEELARHLPAPAPSVGVPARPAEC